MSNVQKFIDLTKVDVTLQARIDDLADGDMDGLIALAAEAGLPFTADDYVAYVIEQAMQDMDNDAPGVTESYGPFPPSK